MRPDRRHHHPARLATLAACALLSLGEPAAAQRAELFTGVFGNPIKTIPQGAATIFERRRSENAFQEVRRSRRTNSPYDRAMRATGLLDICRLNAFGRCVNETCTAVRIDQNAILTAAHCVKPKDAAHAEKMLFVPGKYRGNPSRDFQRFEVNPTPLAWSAADEEDWAVLLLEPDDRLDEWPIAIASRSAPLENEPLFIFHHPYSAWKMYSSYGCRALPAEPAVLANLAHGFLHGCGTLPGSSGAPIFDQVWHLIGVHTDEILTQGSNRGVAIDRIFQDAKAARRLRLHNRPEAPPGQPSPGGADHATSRTKVRVLEYLHSSSDASQHKRVQRIVLNNVSYILDSLETASSSFAYLNDVGSYARGGDSVFNPRQLQDIWDDPEEPALQVLYGEMLELGTETNDILVNSEIFLGQLPDSAGIALSDNHFSVASNIRINQYGRIADGHTFFLLYALILDALRTEQPSNVILALAHSATVVHTKLESNHLWRPDWDEAYAVIQQIAQGS